MKTKVSLVKKSDMKMKAAAPGGKAGAVVEFVFEDQQDSTCKVWGVDAAGQQVDIASVAKLDPPPISMDASKVTVDAPNGMEFTMHAAGPLTAPGQPVNIDVTATWNDDPNRKYEFTLPVNVIAGGPTGIIVVPGPPTSR